MLKSKMGSQRRGRGARLSTRRATLSFHRLLALFSSTHAELRRQAASAVNSALVLRNWLYGMYLVEYEQSGSDRARYGERLLETVAERLRDRGIRGLGYTYLAICRNFYRTYPSNIQTVSEESVRGDRNAVIAIGQTLSEQLRRRFKLSWSHYAFLLTVSDAKERSFYEIESARENWSLRELKRQFDSALFERLALSRRKDEVARLARRGHIIASPADAIKDPYVLEFLGLEELAAFSESDLEAALIDKLQHFLLELGKGFLFQARQFRFTFDDRHFRVDLVFYNRLLRCFVLLDLKIGELAHQDLGQMQMYVNYFDREVKSDSENPTVGIILCKTKSSALVEMTLPKENRRIFASRYQLYLPSKAELKAQILDVKGTVHGPARRRKRAAKKTGRGSGGRRG